MDGYEPDLPSTLHLPLLGLMWKGYWVVGYQVVVMVVQVVRYGLAFGYPSRVSRLGFSFGIKNCDR